MRPNVFLRRREPIAQFSMDNHFADQIKKLFIKAGVKTEGKHCGLHSSTAKSCNCLHGNGDSDE